jgi:biopolymer transport protein ExbD
LLPVTLPSLHSERIMLLAQLPPREEVGLDFTPIIDVVFNLLIFFLVATSFQQVERESRIALPEMASAVPISAALREIVINVDEAGSFILLGKVTSEASLSETLTRAIAANPNQKVSVRADRATRYEAVARALDLCKAAGITEPYLESVPRR